MNCPTDSKDALETNHQQQKHPPEILTASVSLWQTTTAKRMLRMGSRESGGRKLKSKSVNSRDARMQTVENHKPEVEKLNVENGSW